MQVVVGRALWIGSRAHGLEVEVEGRFDVISTSLFDSVTSPSPRRADCADRPARPVQAFVAGFDVGRPGHGGDGTSRKRSPPDGRPENAPVLRTEAGYLGETSDPSPCQHSLVVAPRKYLIEGIGHFRFVSDFGVIR
jgi:hypothetical protein